MPIININLNYSGNKMTKDSNFKKLFNPTKGPKAVEDRSPLRERIKSALGRGSAAKLEKAEKEKDRATKEYAVLQNAEPKGTVDRLNPDNTVTLNIPKEERPEYIQAQNKAKEAEKVYDEARVKKATAYKENTDEKKNLKEYFELEKASKIFLNKSNDEKKTLEVIEPYYEALKAKEEAHGENTENRKKIENIIELKKAEKALDANPLDKNKQESYREAYKKTGGNRTQEQDKKYGEEINKNFLKALEKEPKGKLRDKVLEVWKDKGASPEYVKKRLEYVQEYLQHKNDNPAMNAAIAREVKREIEKEVKRSEELTKAVEGIKELTKGATRVKEEDLAKLNNITKDPKQISAEEKEEISVAIARIGRNGAFEMAPDKGGNTAKFQAFQEHISTLKKDLEGMHRTQEEKVPEGRSRAGSVDPEVVSNISESGVKLAIKDKEVVVAKPEPELTHDQKTKILEGFSKEIAVKLFKEGYDDPAASNYNPGRIEDQKKIQAALKEGLSGDEIKQIANMPLKEARELVNNVAQDIKENHTKSTAFGVFEAFALGESDRIQLKGGDIALNLEKFKASSPVQEVKGSSANSPSASPRKTVTFSPETKGGAGSPGRSLRFKS